jgi:Ca2+-transporting ATPase
LVDLFKLVILTSSVFWVDEARKYWKSRSKRRLGGGYSQAV